MVERFRHAGIAAQQVRHAGAVLRHHQIDHRAMEQFGRAMPQHRMHPVADEGVPAIRVGFPDELTGYADDVEEPAVALPQAAFDLDPLGKIMSDHREAQQAAGFTLPDRRDGGRAEEAGPVLTPMPALHRVPPCSRAAAISASGRPLAAASGGKNRE